MRATRSLSVLVLLSLVLSSFSLDGLTAPAPLKNQKKLAHMANPIDDLARKLIAEFELRKFSDVISSATGFSKELSWELAKKLACNIADEKTDPLAILEAINGTGLNLLPNLVRPTPTAGSNLLPPLVSPTPILGLPMPTSATISYGQAEAISNAIKQFAREYPYLYVPAVFVLKGACLLFA